MREKVFLRRATLGTARIRTTRLTVIAKMTLFATFSTSSILHELLKRNSSLLVFRFRREWGPLVRSLLGWVLTFLYEFRCFLDIFTTGQGLVLRLLVSTGSG